MFPTPGTVKKKTISEAVSCLFFLPVFEKGTNIIATNPETNTTLTTNVKSVNQEVVAPVSQNKNKEITNRRLRSESLATPSIAGILGGKKSAEDSAQSIHLKSAEHLLHEPFNEVQLTHAWKEFAETVDAAQLRSALSVREPFLVNESTVGYDLDNEVQLQRITMDVKPKLLAHLHNALQNEKISLEFNVTENKTEILNKPYTNQEKFNALASKYPILGLIRQQFGLDFE